MLRRQENLSIKEHASLDCFFNCTEENSSFPNISAATGKRDYFSEFPPAAPDFRFFENRKEPPRTPLALEPRSPSRKNTTITELNHRQYPNRAIPIPQVWQPAYIPRYHCTNSTIARSLTAWITGCLEEWIVGGNRWCTGHRVTIWVTCHPFRYGAAFSVIQPSVHPLFHAQSVRLRRLIPIEFRLCRIGINHPESHRCHRCRSGSAPHRSARRNQPQHG